MGLIYRNIEDYYDKNVMIDLFSVSLYFLSVKATLTFRYDLIRKPGEKAGEIFVSVIFRDVELSGEVRRNSSPTTTTPVCSSCQ